MFASGVRRSWLAQATSWRRASKSRSRFAAISLNAAASSRQLGGAVLGRARREVAAREPRGRRHDRVRARSRSTGQQEGSRRRTAEAAPAATTSTDLTSCADSNITTPDSDHGGERQRRPRAAPARRAAAARVAAAAARTRRRARRRASPTATTSAKPITARTGSRRPRPSARKRGLRGVVLDLLAQPPDVDGDGARVERRLVAPDAVHQLVAREDLARMAWRGTRAGRTPSPSAAARRPSRRTSRVSASISSSPNASRSLAGDAAAPRAAAPCARGRRARAARTASSRSRPRRARARRSGRPPRRGPSA